MQHWKSDNRTGAMKLEAQVAAALGWTHNTEQVGGLTPDMVCPNGFTYEFKNLARRPATSAWIETATSYDNKATWRESGIPKQARVCDYFLFAIPGGQLLKVPSKTLVDLINQGEWAGWVTRPNANGNRDGHFARGVHIPFGDLVEAHGSELMPLPEGINPASTDYSARPIKGA